MKPVKIIGIGLSIEDITLKQKKTIEEADFLIGGTEQLNNFKNLNVKKLEIKSNLPVIVEAILKKIDTHNIVVIASGDPLFFGIGAYLVKKIGKENVIVFPNISSVATAFSKINEPWHDAQLVSLHGKRSENVSILFSGKKKFGVLTDKKKDPAWIANKIIEEKESGFSMCVLEKLGSNQEKITWFDDLSKVQTKKFLYPNIVILKRKPLGENSAAFRQIRIGIDDQEFYCEKGLITKSEIRSIVLSKLNFERDNHVFWDLGAGSGSVSIEASSIIPQGSIYAVEKNSERVSIINKNISKFKVPNIIVVNAELPNDFDKLPVPDRIFIGGGGKDLANITEQAINKLTQNGIIVVNTILIQNIDSVFSIMEKKGLNPQATSVQISRSKSMPHGNRFEALNPIWIIYGQKGIIKK
ncbi:MAG: precorrin-6y C5,15-methyltransferase (decarboxylating) subunit CbiE [Desulfobacteraceae bacterium]|nr:precorrin-6y C5,15-methyltransferase (decarboxylating) subunit CbiE [Desulfobacteraceae bacterium]